MSLLKSFKVSELPWRWYAIALVAIVLDQLTKLWVTAELALYDREIVTSFFQITLRHNYGAAFSFLHDAGGWQRWFLGVLAAGVSVLLAVWIAKLKKTQWLEALALSLILGGAVGNLLDRAVFGYVVDFILFHYQQHEFPAFNIADSAISCGAVLLIWDAIFTKKKQENEAVTQGESNE